MKESVKSTSDWFLVNIAFFAMALEPHMIGKDQGVPAQLDPVIDS